MDDKTVQFMNNKNQGKHFLTQITLSLLYVTNKNHYKDLKLLSLNDLAKSHYTKLFSKLHTHTNSLIKNISSATHVLRRLKRQWPRKMLNARKEKKNS